MRDIVGQLHALYQAWKEKLDSQMVLVKAAQEAFEKRIEETRAHFAEAHQGLKADHEKLRAEQDELLLKSCDIQKEEEEDRRRISDEDIRLNALWISLESHEEELANREKALDGRLRAKDEEVEKLVARRTQELVDQRKDALAAQALEHDGALQEVAGTIASAEAAREEFADKLKKLEEDLEGPGKKISALAVEREYALSNLTEAQDVVSNKSGQLCSANASLAALKDKLAPLERSLDESKDNKEVLAQKLLVVTKQLEAASAAREG